MKTITASAPGKLLIFGDHAVVYGHPCIVTAIDRRLYVTVSKRDDDLLVFNTPNVQEKSFQKKMSEDGNNQIPKCLQFLEAVLVQFKKQFPQTTLTGLNITTRSQFSDQYGFGSSSAVSVAFAFALTNLFDLHLDNQQLFNLVYPAIIDVQTVGSGFDIAAAIWGGTIYYVSPAKVVEQLSSVIPAPTVIPEPGAERQVSGIHGTSVPLIVGYTGIKASTAQVIQQVAQLRAQNNQLVESIFTEITKIVDQAKVALQQSCHPRTHWHPREGGDPCVDPSNLELIGKLMQQNQALLNELNVSSPKLDQLISGAQTAGATGAKLSGAGGGDCMIAVGAEQKRLNIEIAITNAGGQILKVKTNAKGVRYETN